MDAVKKDVLDLNRKKLQFFMPMKNPPTATHQMQKVTVNKKTGKPVFYEPEEVKQARSTLQAHLAKHKPDKPFDTAVQVVTKWLFHSDNHDDGEWKITRPDTHNMNKLLFDVMTDLGFWADDSLVVSETIQKFYVNGTTPGIYISIKEV